MKRLYIATSVAIAALFAISVWKNHVCYGFKSWTWQIVKSVIDTTLVVASALYSPAFLVSWSVAWFSRPFVKSGYMQLTIGVAAGILFHSIGGIALEVLCITGIFSVDLTTGMLGAYGWWLQGPPETFLRRAK
jgi:hypothetical protein